jgi:hypothetical protein
MMLRIAPVLLVAAAAHAQEVPTPYYDVSASPTSGDNSPWLTVTTGSAASYSVDYVDIGYAAAASLAAWSNFTGSDFRLQILTPYESLVAQVNGAEMLDDFVTDPTSGRVARTLRFTFEEPIVLTGSTSFAFWASELNQAHNLLWSKGVASVAVNDGGWSQSFWSLGVGEAYDLSVGYAAVPVPEPSTYGLVIGALALAVAARRRRKA